MATLPFAAWLRRGFGVGLVLASLVGVCAVPVAAAPPAVPLLVTLADGAPVPALGAMRGVRAVREIGARVLRVDVVAAEVGPRLAALPGVLAVEPDGHVTLAAEPDDPRYPEQWAHEVTGTARAWDVTTGSADVRVAVVDSGILGDHRDLSGNVVEPQVVVKEGTVTTTGTGVDNDSCQDGHGTEVAGIIGAVGDNGTDVAGVAWDVSLVDIAVLHADTSCRIVAYSDVAAALTYAARGPGGPVDVVNLSLGGPAESCPTALQVAVDEARAAGVVVVAAAGNDERSLPGQSQIPASCNGVISVGATGRDGDAAHYSSRNPYVDLAAPGGDLRNGGESGLVLTTGRVERVQSTEGTSFSAPYVAGVAALLRAVRGELSAADVESLLETTATDVDAAGRDEATGWGVVDAEAAVLLAARARPVAEPVADPQFPVGVSLSRVAADVVPTEAITQAVAVSTAAFASQSALHAVVARADDYADALAGSALAYGVGPLLFTGSTGPLASGTRHELRRVLPVGATVYLLGGTAALPASLDSELRALGFSPARLAGRSREETAVAVANEVARQQLPAMSAALLATRGDWPDAVTGGALASYFGLPILLTPPDELHPATAVALAELAPARLFVLGGAAAVSDETMAAAAHAAGAEGVRLGGAARDATAVAIAGAMEALLSDSGREPAGFLAVNVDRSDGFAHVLSAAALAGKQGSVFVPVRGQAGDVLPDVAAEHVRGRGIDVTVIGGADLVSDEVGERLQALLSEA